MGLWTPAYLENGSNLWIDFGDEAKVTVDTGAIASVLDKSGRGGHAYQSTIASRPAYVDWGTNSLKCASFDGANDSLAGALAQTYTSRSLFIVGRFPYNNTTAKYFFAEWLTGNAVNADRVALSLVAVYAPRTLRTNNNYWRLNISDDTNLVASHTNSGSLITNRLNGELSPEGTGSSGAYYLVGSTISNYRIGGKDSPTDLPMYGFIGEIISLHYEASAIDVQKIEGYLAWKWGVQGSLIESHPYRNFAPAETADFRIVSYPSVVSGNILKVEVGNFTVDTPIHILEASASNQLVAFGGIVSPAHTISSSLDPIIGVGNIESIRCSISGDARMQTYGISEFTATKPDISGRSMGQIVMSTGEIAPGPHALSGHAQVNAVGNTRINAPLHLINGVGLFLAYGNADIQQPPQSFYGTGVIPLPMQMDMLQPKANVNSLGTISLSGAAQLNTGTHRVSSSGVGPPNTEDDSVLQYRRTSRCQVIN